METTQTTEMHGDAIRITNLEMRDKRPESPTPAKLARIAAMVLPENCTGRIDVVQGANRITFWGRGENWGKTVAALIAAGNTAEVEVSNGIAKIKQY